MRKMDHNLTRRCSFSYFQINSSVERVLYSDDALVNRLHNFGRRNFVFNLLLSKNLEYKCIEPLDKKKV